MSQPPPPPPNGGPEGQPYTPPGGSGTNGLAIAALVLGITGFIAYAIPAILALIFGYRAKGQIDASGGVQGGRGMALAGIILGWIWIGVYVVILLIVIIASVGEGS
jgi:hypothetical protein